MFRYLILSLLAVFTLSAVFAQRTIVGTISDCEGPLPGATIQIKGCEVETFANESGFYSIEVPKQYDTKKLILIFSVFGVTSKIKVKGRDTLNVKLEQQNDESADIMVDKPVSTSIQKSQQMLA